MSEQITLDQLIAKLHNLATTGNSEAFDHIEADQLLLKYINDEQVTKEFEAINKWYA